MNELITVRGGARDDSSEGQLVEGVRQHYPSPEEVRVSLLAKKALEAERAAIR
jgi:hypothetical protein